LRHVYDPENEHLVANSSVFFLIRALGADVEIVMLDLELGKSSLLTGKSAAHRAAVMKSGQRGTLPKSVT